MQRGRVEWGVCRCVLVSFPPSWRSSSHSRGRSPAVGARATDRHARLLKGLQAGSDINSRTPSKSPAGSRACSPLWVSLSTDSVRGRLATTCHWRCCRSELCVRAGSGLGGHGSSARVPRPTSLGYRSHRSWRLEPEPSSMDQRSTLLFGRTRSQRWHSATGWESHTRGQLAGGGESWIRH